MKVLMVWLALRDVRGTPHCVNEKWSGLVKENAADRKEFSVDVFIKEALFNFAVVY